jgi:hypothetical protein
VTSVTVTPGVLIPVHTTVNHLTLIDLDSPIEDLAAQTSSFDIQWRDHTIFVFPKQSESATNLFVWTKRGRVVYELLPAASTLDEMQVSIDTHFPAPVPPTKPTVAQQSTDPIPSDLLVRAQPVTSNNKLSKHGSHLLISDVYRRQDSLFLRYEVRNNGTSTLNMDATPVITAASLAPVATNKPVQLRPDQAANITTGVPLPLIADQLGASSLAPGQSSRGVIGVHIPPNASTLAVRLVVPSQTAPLQAMVVVP